MNQMDLSFPRTVIDGIYLFNQGKFFEAHEALEIAWREEPGHIRFLYQGILQLGIGYYHLERGNLSGARKLLDRARLSLMKVPEDYHGINVSSIIDHVQELHSYIMDSSLSGVTNMQMPLHKITMTENIDYE
jgi:hypothetical protein